MAERRSPSHSYRNSRFVSSLFRFIASIDVLQTEYGHYMSKKANLRRQKIVTLSDYHREEIEDLRRQKESMLERYQQKKQGLRQRETPIEKHAMVFQILDCNWCAKNNC